MMGPRMTESPFTQLLRRDKDALVRLMMERMGQSGPSPYKQFILNTEEGRRRLSVWLDLIARAMEGTPEDFLEDQKRVGYYRAVQGFKLEHVSELYTSLQDGFFQILSGWATEQHLPPGGVRQVLMEFGRVFAQGYAAVAESFLKTREEQITEKVLMLQQLQDFTQGALSSGELCTLLRLAMARIQSILNVEQVYTAIYRDEAVQSIYCCPSNNLSAEIESLLARSWDQNRSLYWDDQGNESPDIEESAVIRGVVVPVEAHNCRYGVLAIRNTQRGFRFSERESNLLRQFVQILALAVENSFMMEQVQRGRDELRLLAGKIINIKERERRKLASDIHDTVAQQLSGIGYKIQFCIELTRVSPEKVAEELESLTQAIQRAIVQCRKLIWELRPDLIDTIGLVPALNRLVRNYSEESGIMVDSSLPDTLKLPGDVRICLFRVVQEALANIQKHSHSDAAHIELYQHEGQVILVVSDTGVGFEMASSPPWMKNPDKHGLLYARERVESIGGRLLIRSREGRGCSLEVRIPYSEEASSGVHITGDDR